MAAETLYLVRHGETTGESRIRLNGATDVALSAHGRAQMEAVRTHLSTLDVDYAVASPLIRSHESAQIIRGPKHYDIHIVEGFREIDFGAWETWTFAEVAERDPEGYARYQHATGDFQFPDGDSRNSFRARISDAALKTLDNATGTMVAALHKGVIKVVTAALLRAPADDYAHQPCDLGSITRLERHDGRWRLVEANQVHHLGDLHLSD